VRQVQVHGERVETATAGQRVALNLAGLEHRFVQRGQAVCTPGVYSSTSRLAVRLELLPGAPALRSGTRVHFHLGTAEASARVVLLDREELAPGLTCLARFRLEDELVAARGDRFVIRSWSPPRTVGGGTVLAPHSWHRRYVAAHLESLRELESGGASGELMVLLEEGEVLRTVEDLAGRLALAPDRVSAVLHELLRGGRVERIAGQEEGGGGEWWASAGRMAALRRRAAELLAAYHMRHPARAGMPRGELRQRLGIADVRAFSALVAGWDREGTVRAVGDRVSAAHFRPASSGALARARHLVVGKLTEGRFSPPTAGELIDEVVRGGVEREHAADLLETLAQEGEIVRISGELYLAPDVYRELGAMVTEFLRRHGSMTAAQFRDLLGTTRKYAIPLLEHLDGARVTRRSGDLRVLYGDAGSAGRAGRDEEEGHE
jgi:selenocysteine-specific elongation factor